MILYEVGWEVKRSNRKWGTGKVSNKTGWHYDGGLKVQNFFGGRVFYGFDD